MHRPSDHRSTSGLLYGIAAYGIWGFIPLYFKSVAHVLPLEVLAHRAFWSFVVLAIVLVVLRRWSVLWQQLRHGRVACWLLLSSLLIALNWLTFIYAVAHGQVVQSSLGYFINPLLSVLLGVVFLRERLRPYQILSIALAVAGVLILTSLVGQIPWIALTLALTFALYGLVRKLTPVDSLMSLAVETLLLMPVALAYLGYLATTAKATGSGLGTIGLLMLAGPVTTVPLLLFGSAARRMRLSTMGILQYLTPTLQMALAVFTFQEPISVVQIASFACIWTAIAIYTADSFQAARQAGTTRAEPVIAEP
jgi:chloramphenicol-sensitive protein RarD